jgi:hypothetical protein
MKTKHTPVPWHSRARHSKNGDIWDFEILTSDMSEIAKVPKEANAKLIATSPDLLDALIMSLNFDMTEVEIAHWEQKTRAAITKATGGNDDQ